MALKTVDYSVYLVTDSSLVPQGTTLVDQVKRALEGGATLVQLREKNLDTGPFIELARQIQTLTRQFGVPLIINDRLDVALAVDADGVHIGQDDMPLTQARRLLGPRKIIGVSVHSSEEAGEAIRNGADYLGIGAVWDTTTKALKTKPLGIEGVKEILASMPKAIPTVAIGGVKQNNAAELLVGSCTGDRYLSGLAVVSAIIASPNPAEVCRDFARLYKESLVTLHKTPSPVEDAVAFAVKAADAIRQEGPMVHHITNYVVINDNANATLAVGASPIMSTNAEEVDDLAAVNGALVLNMGTLENADVMILAAHANSRRGNPVVFDPVGAGATQFRKRAVERFLKETSLTVLKGNAGEILSIAGRGGRSRGVDSIGDNGGEENAALAVKELALKHGCVVAMTGQTDYVSDGHRTFAIDNGDALLATITGSGCMVSSIVGCYVAANRDDYLLATVAGLLTVTVASEVAVKRGDVKGPNTFRAALIDELYNVTRAPQLLKEYAKVRLLDV